MQGTEGLGALLNDEEQHATFHDARLLSVEIDYQTRTLVAMWPMCVGDPEASERRVRERRREGRLTLCGLAFWVIEPPTEVKPIGGLPWLTADGPLSEATSAIGRGLAQLLPAEAAGWYLYFSDWNAFAYCGASTATFEWV
jgi:hypothetical protein